MSAEPEQHLISSNIASPSRCGSVTLAGKQRTVLFSNTLVPLRYSVPFRARVGICERSAKQTSENA